MSTSLPTPKVSPNFKFPEADIILLSAETSFSGIKHDSCQFKVHREKLRVASPVFADMLSLGEHQDKRQKSSDLPSVQLTESMKTVDAMLRYIYADNVSTVPGFDTTEPGHVLEVFNAAAKYGIPTLQSLTELSLR